MGARSIMTAGIALVSGGFAMAESWVPADPPMDAVMASETEVQAAHEWAHRVFCGEDTVAAAGPIALAVRRQDHNVLRFRESCMETPLRIGRRAFERGLGTHANSEIAVAVPEGAHRFAASVGVDNNDDTGGVRGSVRFLVEADGQELASTPVIAGDQGATDLDVALPRGTREIVLKVDATPDGPAYDQADWADARFTMDDGSVRFLDEGHSVSFLRDASVPFSFLYGEQASASLLPGWSRTVSEERLPGRTRTSVSYDDPATGLRVTAEVTTFDRFPAIDWVLYFENRGGANTPILSQVQALDLETSTGNSKRAAVLHTLIGDVCGETTFTPTRTPLGIGQSISAAPQGGRPSNQAWPFLDLEYRNEGVITAIGWSGQWAYSLDRAASGPTRLRAGMELTHFYLSPGERIRSPRIVLLPWSGDRTAAHNRFRRLVLYEYAPRIDGRPAQLPIAAQCFDRYSSSRPGWATEDGQIAAAHFAKRIGCDAHWLDAAWFPGGFPNGVGNWTHKEESFPNGLGPVGRECDKLGLKFVLWFEPERVAAGTQIAREHPEFVFGGEAGGLFRLDDPAARRWLTDLLSARIEEYGIDIYRNDFNIDPLPFWRANDAADRQGMTEIRYVEGHYAMWDELRDRHPGLLIDNCASGGRRIDIETCSRSVPLWRSDTSCSPGHPDWNQAQSYGLSLYIPLHTACGWVPDAYDFRSSAAGGVVCQFDYLNPDFPARVAKAAIEETKEDQPYWYGDFYPLTSCSTKPDQWIAYQLHRADSGSGIVLAFRRHESPYPAVQVSLQALSADQKYAVEFVDGDRHATTRKMRGKELTDSLELRLPSPGDSLVLRYRPED